MANKISVIIDVVVDKANASISSFKKSIQDADGAAGKFKAGAASAFASLQANAGNLVLAAGAMAVAFGTKAVDAASDLEESTNAVNKSFGQAADGVLEIGESAAESFGLSQAAFNAAAVSFASFAQTVAGPGGDVATVIEDLTTRAADFASVMNIDVAEASTVFRSGLSGETEPLKKFGIDLSAAAVEAYALSSGLVESKTEMTEGIKVQARYGLLMQKTGQFAGDFADTSDGLANSSRVLGASMTDLSAKLGEKLTPSIATAVGWAITFLDVMDAITDLPGMTVRLPGVDDADIESWREYRDLQQAAAGGNKDAQEQFRNGGKELDVFTEALGSTSAATRRYEEDVSRQSDAQAINAAKTMESAAAAEDAAAAEEERTEAIDASWEALDRQREAQEAANNAVLEGISSSLNFRNQQATTAATINESNLILLDSKRTTDEQAQAARDAEGAALDWAAAAVQLAEDQAAANGETFTAEEKAALYKAELEKLAAFLTGPAKLAILGYIEDLGKIPQRVDTTLALNAVGRASTIAVSGYRASGGPVSAGGAYVVGEEGPELLQMGSQGGNVIPNGAVVGGGSGGATYVFNISNATDPDAVVRAIRQHVKRNGPIQGIT